MRPSNNLFPTSQILDSVFNRSISDIIGTDFVSTQPAVNIAEKEDGYEIEVAAPGLSKSDFEITIDKNTLVVSGNKEASSETEEGNIKRKEFNYASFKRSFTIDETVDRNSTNANYKNGILVIKLSKKEEAIDRGPIHIDIK